MVDRISLPVLYGYDELVRDHRFVLVDPRAQGVPAKLTPEAPIYATAADTAERNTCRDKRRKTVEKWRRNRRYDRYGWYQRRLAIFHYRRSASRLAFSSNSLPVCDPLFAFCCTTKSTLQEKKKISVPGIVILLQKLISNTPKLEMEFFFFFLPLFSSLLSLFTLIVSAEIISSVRQQKANFVFSKWILNPLFELLWRTEIGSTYLFFFLLSYVYLSTWMKVIVR